MQIIPVEQRGYAHPELIAETSWLATHISDDNIRIIDARSSEDYDESHIEGSVNLSGFRGIPRTESGELGDPEIFSEIASNLGISNNTTVIVYDTPSQMMGTVAWAFLYYGHSKTKILDGGINKWISEGNAVSKTIPEYPKTSFKAELVKSIYCSLNDAKKGVTDTNTVFWDTRSLGEYEGSTPIGKTPPGRIPGAVHLEWVELFDKETKTLKSSDELNHLLLSKGITPEKVVNSY
ncbi:MAG: rhodanese-like domain-containing protein [Chloroflexota bacterium]|nr:rhodanese-like domain-containing protein [Chloroflexota bacterium]